MGKNNASIPDFADAFVKGILAGEQPFYVYGTTIVEPVTDPDSGTGRLRTITVPDLKWYVRREFRDERESTISAVAEDILHNPQLPLKRIGGLVTTPTFREDLSLVTAPGFDAESGLYYSPDPSLRSFIFETDRLKKGAKESLDLLFELLIDFPFQTADERYTYLAILLTLFLRSAIRGIIPCLAIDGNGQSVDGRHGRQRTPLFHAISYRLRTGCIHH